MHNYLQMGFLQVNKHYFELLNYSIVMHEHLAVRSEPCLPHLDFCCEQVKQTAQLVCKPDGHYPALTAKQVKVRADLFMLDEQLFCKVCHMSANTQGGLSTIVL